VHGVPALGATVVPHLSLLAEGERAYSEIGSTAPARAAAVHQQEQGEKQAASHEASGKGYDHPAFSDRRVTRA
jgi:hypothetical protein